MSLAALIVYIYPALVAVMSLRFGRRLEGRRAWFALALALVLFTINGETRTLMFGDPLGQQMMIGAGVLQVIGALIIRKIINVEY